MFGTVVVVDDEVLVRKTLIKMIESNDTGWEVIGEASNGDEALQIINETKPELIITDIRMPKMDGLQLAEKLYNQENEMKVIILTGYKDFDYAQTALKFGVIDFLLKPCPEEEVCAALDKVSQRIQKQKQLEQIEQQLAEETAIRSIFERLPIDQFIIEQIKNKYAISRLCFVYIQDFFPTDKKYRKEELNLLQFAVHNVISELVQMHAQNGTIIPVRFNAYVLLVEDPSEESMSNGWIDDFFELLQKTIYDLMGISLRTQYVGSIDDMDELFDLYSEMEQQYSATQDEPIADMLSVQEHVVYSAQIESLESQFMSYILIGNIQKLEIYLDKEIESLEKSSLHEARLEALIMAVALDRTIRKQFLTSTVRLDIGSEIEELYRLQEQSQIVTWIRSWLTTLMGEVRKWSKSNNENIIEQATKYIEQHYAQKCSLQDVAAHVYLNHKYFGYLFKRETGESFVNYVTRIRLEKGAFLLSNTNLMVTQIAKSCGYDDPNYFTTVFRKKYDLTPNEFRKTHK